ncbi:MAG: hypothetical protein Phog2KO_13560 [Phototrophicaceae bacterium]
MSQIRKNISVMSLAIIFTFIAFYLMFSATWAGTAGGLLAGSFMAGLTLVLGLISFAIQYQRHQSSINSKQKSVDKGSVQQTRTIEIDMPFEEAFTLALEALETLDGEAIPKTITGIPSKQSLKIQKSDLTIGRIEAGLRAKTFGIQDFTSFSRVTVQLQRLDNQTTRLQIDSAPTSQLDTLDFGRHAHYVNTLALYMRQASATQHLEDSARNEADTTSHYSEQSTNHLAD